MNKLWNLQKNTLFPSVNYTELKKNSDSYKLFVDYLKLWFQKESVVIDSYLKLLVSENSDMSILEFKWYTISVNSFRGRFWLWLRFSVSYNSISVELCTVQFIRCFVNDNCATKYVCEFKWQYFRLETMWYFEQWFYKVFCDYLFNKEDGAILRIDRTCDFFLKEHTDSKNLYLVSPFQLLWKNGIRANTNTRIFGKWKELKALLNAWNGLEKKDSPNWYYGSRNGKRVMLRVYDKLKDLRKETGKWKELLYIDYLKNEKIIRVEFECMQRFCMKNNWISYLLSELNELLEKCDSVFHFNEKERYGATCYEYKAIENVIDLSSKSQSFQLKYFDNFWQHWYTIFENNVNPYVILNEQILDRTEKQFIPYTKNRIKDFLREATDSIDL